MSTLDIVATYGDKATISLVIGDIIADSAGNTVKVLYIDYIEQNVVTVPTNMLIPFTTYIEDDVVDGPTGIILPFTVVASGLYEKVEVISKKVGPVITENLKLR